MPEFVHLALEVLLILLRDGSNDVGAACPIGRQNHNVANLRWNIACHDFLLSLPE